MKACQVKLKAIALKEKPRGPEEGFTLMEILLALSIFAVGILAVASMQIRSMQVNNLASNITESTTWAQDTMEDLITRPWNDTLLTAGATHSLTETDGTVVTWTVTDVNVGGSATVNVKRINLLANYGDGLGNTKTTNITGSYSLLAVP
jgi:prepilin-type N-terminal cleavage/methylation domain-containing protein